MAIRQHEDFGEKIGGAKKDIWGARGLMVDDLLQMNDREAEKYVKKDNIWKKPDYQAMMDGGVPLGVAYYIKKVRDSLHAAPRYYRSDDTLEKRVARQKQYIETIREIEAVMGNVRSVEDALGAFERVMLGGGYMQRTDGWAGGTHYAATEKGRENPVITDKLANVLRVRSVRSFEADFTQKAIREQFGVPKEDKTPPGYKIHLYSGDGYSKNGDWEANTYYVTKGRYILQTNLKTREEALQWAQAAAKEMGKGGKTRFVPPQLANVQRTGPDYRSGRDVTGQDYLDAFGFRGGEFGNWLNQEDRQASLNMGFEALKDLAAVLKISEKDIAFQGALAIAFGARGSGNAMAHYEPMRKVINLTKMRGAGSLAHEWWHGLDDYLGGKMGARGMLSTAPHKYPLMQKLVDTMKYKAETPEQAAKRAEQMQARTVKSAEGWLDSSMKYYIDRNGGEAVKEKYAALKAAFLNGEPGSVDKLNAMKKDLTGHVIPKEDRERLKRYEYLLSPDREKEPPTIGRTETDYYRNSKAMGKVSQKDGGYWESNEEMTARAFACYVLDRLKPERSDYLCGHADCALTFAPKPDGGLEILKAFPEGEERKAINAVFDEIIAELKRDQILTHAERPAALEAIKPLSNEKHGQLTLFDAKPSMLGQLAEAKARSKGQPPQDAAKREPTHAI